jgi:hypothetical protein
VVSSNGGVNMKQLKRSLKSSKDSDSSKSTSSGKKNEDKDLDTAVDMLKSFF